MSDVTKDRGFRPVQTPRKFFKKGRVIIVNWIDPSSDAGTHKKDRWFIVIRPRPTHCVCLPITTYKGQGTSKAGVNADDHAALVEKDHEVRFHAQEFRLKRAPIFAKVEDMSMSIHPMSRINFSKVYTIEYNLPVRTVGRVLPSSIEALENYFRESMGVSEKPESHSQPDTHPQLEDISDYCYSPLERNEIRLLQIHPTNGGKDDDVVQATILTKRLNDASVDNIYSALSYIRGNDEPSHRVEIIDRALPSAVQFSSRKLIRVQDNLYGALRDVRRRGKDDTLWVDAICIDQNSLEEKNSQVALMARIYQSAKNVCIWLGRGNASTDRAMNYVRRVINDPSTNKLANFKADLEAFKTLMMAKWFTRRWVLQEVGLARNATVHCGQKWVRWEDFTDVVAISISQTLPATSICEEYSSLRETEVFPAAKLIMTLGNILRKAEDGAILDYYLGIEGLLSLTSTFEASKPHDYIFALLSLAHDVPQRLQGMNKGQSGVLEARYDIIIDYGRDDLELLVWFTQLCIQNSRSLDIICRPWAPDVERFNDGGSKIEFHYPSWIKKLSSSAVRKSSSVLQGRQPEVNLFSYSCYDAEGKYNAANGIKAKYAFDKCLLEADMPATENIDPNTSDSNASSTDGDDAHPISRTPATSRSSTWSSAASSLYPHTLTVQGVYLTTIKVCSKYNTGTIDAQWLRYCGWRRDKPHIVPDMLWRTLVADRGPNGWPPAPWYRGACVMCLNDAALMTTDSDLDITKKPNSDLMLKYLDRVKSVILNRKFFLGHKPEILRHEPEILGLTPEDVKVGDLICVLTGCTVPVILRPLERSRRPGYFEIVGEAYVYGYMDGEAMLEDKLQPFTLV